MKWKRRGARAAALVCALLALPTLAGPKPPSKQQPKDTYVPAPADQIPGYSPKKLPCELMEEARPPRVVCTPPELLSGKSLRELSILRNTIFARYGWDGYRKEWLRDYFHQQPWFKPDANFGYRRLSDVDRKNVHLIASVEQGFTERELRQKEADVLARAGKVWNDAPVWTLKNGREVRSCEPPKEPLDDSTCQGLDCGDALSWDCVYRQQPWYKPDPNFTEEKLTVEQRIELGLLSRAMGRYASDSGKLETNTQASLDRVLSVKELRKLSLRDLRLLRNTLFARRGRTFKSKVLQAHFASMSWYTPDLAYTDARLTETDKRNIDLIRSVEDEFGGPLQDADWLVDPATDFA